MPRVPNGIQGYGRVDLERSLRCVYPLIKDHGGFWVEKHVQAALKAWERPLAIPKDKHVTLAYTDPPGNITKDEIYLSVETLDTHKDTIKNFTPDVPTNPAYEDGNHLPVYGHINNLQKVALRTGDPAAVHCHIRILPCHTCAKFIGCFLDSILF